MSLCLCCRNLGKKAWAYLRTLNNFNGYNESRNPEFWLKVLTSKNTVRRTDGGNLFPYSYGLKMMLLLLARTKNLGTQLHVKQYFLWYGPTQVCLLHPAVF